MAEVTWWRLQAAAFLPLPLLLVAVLSAPAPRDVRRRVLWFTEQVLGWEVRRPFQVMHFAVVVTGASVVACLAPMLQAQQELAAVQGKRDPNTLVLLLAQKFRHERNFWMSLYTFTAWVVLLIVHKVNREKHELRGRLLALQGCGGEAAHEVTFLGRQAEAEMQRVGKEAAAGPLAQSVARLAPLHATSAGGAVPNRPVCAEPAQPAAEAAGKKGD